MIKLTQVTISKYRSILKPQTVDIDSSITTIVGMNESGKTAFLTALAKTNYFADDSDFEFDIIHDYPRSGLIDFQHSEDDCDIIECKYEISARLLGEIENEFGKGVFTTKEFTYTCHYKNKERTFGGLSTDLKKYLNIQSEKFELSVETRKAIKETTSLNEISAIIAVEGDTDLPALKAEIKKIIDGGYQNPSWTNQLESYITKTWIKAKMPKFWYYDVNGRPYGAISGSP